MKRNLKVPAVVLSAVTLLGMALAVSCGDEDSPVTPQACSSANCGGCCDVNGQCMSGSSETVCGKGGLACAICKSGETCQKSQCVVKTQSCSASNCPGCCIGTQCMDGTLPTACGRDGLSCQVCQGSQTCVGNICTQAPCDATNCKDGCCYNGSCVKGDNKAACGSGGQVCKACASGEICENQQCKTSVCGPGNCKGCCDAKGSCIASPNETNCGKEGGACVACKEDQTCAAGVCQDDAKNCSSANCSGCCDKTGACVPGNAGNGCGTGGAACKECSTSQECVSQKCTCTESSCGGCCSGDQCKGGGLDSECGTDGETCTSCGTEEKCVQGQCSQECDPASCPGCCDSTGQCQSGLGDSACGMFGESCKACSSGESCEAGTCNDPSKCSSANCNPGCCMDSACKSGTDDLACGRYGEVCKRCPSYQECDMFNACTAKPSSQWDVTLESMELDTADYDCDGVFPECELYLEITVGGVTKKSSYIDDDNAPVLNEFLLTATAKDLTDTDAVHIKVLDYDPLNDDDLIAECDSNFFIIELDYGTGTIFCSSCPGCEWVTINFSFKPADTP